jgi:hypothetical protein
MTTPDYDTDLYTWTQTQAAALRARRAEGLSHQAIADRLNKENVPTRSGRGQWQAGTIGKLLQGAG